MQTAKKPVKKRKNNKDQQHDRIEHDMTAAGERKFAIYYWPICFIIILIALSFSLRYINQRNLSRAEIDIRASFKKFRAIRTAQYIPQITVASPNGTPLNLRDNKKKLTVLNVWATWCAPCVSELPSLARLDKQLGHKWRVIAVSIDTKNNIDRVAAFTEKYNVTNIAGYYDYNQELQNALKVNNLPLTLILNKYGRILYRIEGDANWHSAEIVNFLKSVEKAH